DGPGRISTSALQKSLEEGSAVLQYDFTRDTLVSILITKKNVKVSYHNYDENTFSKSLLALNNSVLFKISAALDAAGKRIYGSLLDPIVGYLEGESISNLIIIPSGPLNTLPFELLRKSEDHPFLIETYQITYHNSLSLREALAAREVKEKPNEMIAFAPVFDQNNKLNLDASRFVREAMAPSLGTTRSFSFDQELQPLPGTKSEVEQLNNLFEGATINAQYFLQSEASEDRVKALNYNKVKYLHFATHGFVNELNPNKSGLFLDPSSNNAEDGILFANEIELLQLNAELVSLSACETGLGTYFMGEGVVGLSRSFFLAGARRVLVSLIVPTCQPCVLRAMPCPATRQVLPT
ncbi:MAG: CHAT domain-containing protein, partial [Cytophagales bacterium]|nr:CHAT domain-containing protein [Cytophagales bacterium]